jgi:hypothetical protein
MDKRRECGRRRREMSAREWYKCPFCKSDMDKAKQEYGKIPVEKFLKKYKEKLVSLDWDAGDEEPSDIETVRMDGEEWLDDDGTYKIEHSMQCNNCNREWWIKVSVKPMISDKNIPNENLTFKIPSKTKEFEHHEVQIKNNVWSCDCVGFRTRKKCSHIEEAKSRYKLSKIDNEKEGDDIEDDEDDENEGDEL